MAQARIVAYLQPEYLCVCSGNSTLCNERRDRRRIQDEIRIHNEGVVEAVDKFSPPPAPPPAGDS